MKRTFLALPAALLLALSLASPAAAELRSPHLNDSCISGLTYGEITVGQWRVEGCHKTGTAQGDEKARTIFKGPVELNGMIVEGSTDLIASEGIHTVDRGRGLSPGQQHFQRIQRSGSAKLVLDPKIGGERRRFVIYTGAVDLELSGAILSSETTTVVHKPVAASRAPSDSSSFGLVDIPVGSDAKILGMRLGGTIHDAKVRVGGNGDGSASIEMKMDMTMGSTASSLLSDCVAKVNVTTVDGTGMQVTNLVFAIPKIEVPGIGGFNDLRVEYSSSRDEWSGGLNIDFGDLFPSLAFDMSISASTGAPTAIEAGVDNLNIPLGPTGIVFQGAHAGFETNPMVLNAGATATAGPEFAGAALVKLAGDLVITLQPAFRFEGTGTVRYLPVGDSEIATGSGHVILDSRGYLSIGGNAHYQVALLGVGIAADISGSGAYSTTTDKFNVEAEATGTLLLGFLGSLDILRYGAVVSSNGWGTCGTFSFFIQAGVGQQWDGNVQLLLGCDLSPFESNVPDPGGKIVAPLARAAAGERERTFRVAPGTNQIAVEIQADGPEPHATLSGPGGAQILSTSPTGPPRAVGANAVVIAPSGSALQYIFAKNPPAGQYTLRWDADGGQVTGLRFARDVAPLRAKVSVVRDRKRPGHRHLKLTGIKGLATGERLAVGVRTPDGIMPIGESAGGSLDAAFDETAPGPKQIVGIVLRNGIPIPGRTRTLGSYIAHLPQAPGKLKTRRLRNAVIALAKPRKGAELPDSWQYVARMGGKPFAIKRGKPGKPVRLAVPRDLRNVTISARPVVRGKVLLGPPLIARVH
jgi:hypothetical protein